MKRRDRLACVLWIENRMSAPEQRALLHEWDKNSVMLRGAGRD